MFREVVLSARGKIFLHSMPARHESWELFEQARNERHVNTILSLTCEKEIAEKSTDYARALALGPLDFQWLNYPIDDYSTPDNLNCYADIVSSVAMRVTDGECILIHCAAGVGRTGVTAICLLGTLGVDLETASRIVKDAGSFPETEAQQLFVEQFFKQRFKPNK